MCASQSCTQRLSYHAIKSGVQWKHSWARCLQKWVLISRHNFKHQAFTPRTVPPQRCLVSTRIKISAVTSNIFVRVSSLCFCNYFFFWLNLSILVSQVLNMPGVPSFRRKFLMFIEIVELVRDLISNTKKYILPQVVLSMNSLLMSPSWILNDSINCFSKPGTHCTPRSKSLASVLDYELWQRF